jgi:hypothetical protein
VKESTAANIEPGSFRDRQARVFYLGDEILRALSETSNKDFIALSNKEFFKRALNEDKIIATKFLNSVSLPTEIQNQGWASVVQHSKVPFVSYPYEWSFSMLKDAALLHLDLLNEALSENFVIKDSSAYNVQWFGCLPVFIDIPSFEPYRPGDIWAGYRQFCQMFLFPLMLYSYKELPFHSLLRGSIDGLEVSDVYKMMSLRDLLRSGVFKHVYLQYKLQGNYASSAKNVRKELSDFGFHKELILANVRSLRKLVYKISLNIKESVWSQYANNNSYTNDDADLKKDFVRKQIQRHKRSLVWDIGANTGTFSQIASENSNYVLAVDADHLAIEHLYLRLKSENNKKILPLTMNLANPSPNQGWRGLERKGLAERGRPDLVMALALIHHAVISANIPLEEFTDWLASICNELIIEFVNKDDVMVKTLLANKEDIYADYTTENFERCLRKHYKIEEKKDLGSKTRALYYCVKL